MFETRWRIFFTGGGQKARGKKISKSKKKKRNISPGCDHPGGVVPLYFSKKKVKVLATWAFKLVPSCANLCLNLIDCFFV
tara:strand:+ start:499 stop:738 length:240 start_codon:yes stop_codon:yes gene_type:complete